MIVEAALLMLMLQAPGTVLRPGDVVEGDMVETDPIARTDALDALTEAPVRAKTFRVEHDGSGPFHIDAHSHFFDTYLIVRGPDGVPLDEDDDGLFRTHSRVVLDAGVPAELTVEVGALNGGLGPFRLVVASGKAEPLDAKERAARDLADVRSEAELHESALGADRPEIVSDLNRLARILAGQGAYAEARTLIERALRIQEAAVGPDHALTALSLSDLARLLRDQGEYEEARPLYERALRIFETALGPDHVNTAVTLNNLAGLLKIQSDYAEARPLYERALRLRESVRGPDHPEIASCLNNLAELLRDQGAYEEARPLYERALRIWEASRGADHPDTATGLNNLATLLESQGAYPEARPLYERALRIRESALGPDHPWTATSLNNLAGLLTVLGAYDEARPLLERALRITESTYGADHRYTATGLSNLAVLLGNLGAHAEARPLAERSLRIRETALGPNHPELAFSLYSLAALLKAEGAFDESLPLLERALQIRETALGPDHPWTAISLSFLAARLKSLGATDEARPLVERALRIRESTLGADHPSTAESLNDLATLLADQGTFSEARPLFERALRIWEAAFGPDHRETATGLNNLALLEADLGELSAGFSRSRAMLVASAGHYSRVAWSMSESERLAFLRTLGAADEVVISLAGALGSADARDAAYSAVLEGKGRVGRGLLRDGLRAVGRLPEEQRTLVRKLRSVQQRLSDAMYATEVADSDAHATKLDELRGERNTLEVDFARLRGDENGEGSKVAEEGARLAALRAALPEDAAAIDFFVHRWYEPAEWDGERLLRLGRWTPAHLSAWVVRAGRPLAQADLGEASVLEEAVRVALSRAGGFRGIVRPSSETDKIDGTLRELLWDPLREAVGDARVVFLSGDRFLGGLPFETLRDEDGTYLIERHAFAYQADLAGLPDVVRPGEVESPRLFAVGGVDYWGQGSLEESDPPAPGDLRASVSRIFPDLRWTDREVSAVGGLHRSAGGRDARQVVLRGTDATEERIKSGLSGFTHVHLATHGFFHPEGVPSAWKILREQDDAGRMMMRESEQRVVGYLPGLLSGLVFAGANAEPEPGRDNGLLTAEEITYLDLTACDLVVLSACETGLGRPEAGEGMIGLRRAFRMAGARTVISSLWEVDDQSTRDLMTLFYENLWRRGMPKLEALRQAQLSILEENRKRHGHGVPSTWGAFVLDGAPE